MLPSLSPWISRLSAGSLLASAAWLSAPAAAQAQEFVSIQGRVVNVRSQPNLRAPIAWELSRGYPLQVVARRGQWVQVRDFEGTLGWVSRPLTAKQPHYLVKVRSANLRAAPGTQHRLIGRLNQYEIVQTLEKRQGWARVRTANGQQGWLHQNLVWGW